VKISRVLVAHNFYLAAARSGEDTVYLDEASQLESAGVEVVRFERRNDDLLNASPLAKASAAMTAGWAPSVYGEMQALLARTRPQVAHFHNVFPQITPAAFAACREAGVAVVQTLHNYRWRCASGLLMRDGKICEECWQGNPFPAIRHACYQDSRLKSLVAVGAQLVNRRAASSAGLVDRYIALTDFSRRKHAAAGLPDELIEVKANCLANAPPPGNGSGGYFLFAGRFGEEKGVRTLLDTWKLLGPDAPRLKMFGSGPLAATVAEKVSADSLQIDVAGAVPRAQLIEAMRDARAVMVPSECYEGFPLVIAEALACGTPVIASRTGGLPEMIQDGISGLLFEPGDATGLARAVTQLAASPVLLQDMRAAARMSYDERYSAARSLERLMNIYGNAMLVSQK
jgi:glycosyltransferase involved in cell wall biosynthesis